MAKDKPSFKQQNLPAWQPILTAGTVLPTFFLIGIAFIPVGIGLLMASNSVQEILVDYTDCTSVEKPNLMCHDQIYPPKSNKPASCKCKLDIQVNYDYKRTVYAYYGLTNFYQNHRRYVRSRDDNQLLGIKEYLENYKLIKDCRPFDKDKDDRPIAPCGAIANSLFNDSFILKSPTGKQVNIFRKNIAWPSDRNIRFRNPHPLDNLESAFNGTGKPFNWPKPVYQLSKDSSENGFQNEGLIVWMQTAALPTFRKLYGIIEEDSNSQSQNAFGETSIESKVYLPKGNYTIEIDYGYPVKMFNGRKRFILSDTSSLGGKNNFLGIAYIVTGSICFILSAVFLYIHKKYGRLSSEIIQINQQTSYLST